MSCKAGIVILTALTIAIGAPASSQTFGVSMGTPISELDVSENIDSEQFRIRPPSPIDLFKTYSVYATQSNGVCGLTALSEEYVDDYDGAMVKEKFSDVSRYIESNFGESSSFHNEAIESAALAEELGMDYWAIELMLGERVYYELWNDPAALYENNVRNIDIRAESVEGGVTFVVLRIQYENIKQCG